MSEVIHYDSYGSRDVYLLCKELWTEPSWDSQKPEGYPNILKSDECYLFTREIKLITCGECKLKANNEITKRMFDLVHKEPWYQAMCIVAPDIILLLLGGILDKSLLAFTGNSSSYTSNVLGSGISSRVMFSSSLSSLK